MRAVLLLALQVGALWPAVHWFALRTRYASETRVELSALVACAVLVAMRARSSQAPLDLRLAGGLTLTASLSWLLLPPLVAVWMAMSAIVAAISALFLGRRFDLHLFGLSSLALPILPLFQYHLSYPLRVVVAEASSVLLRFSGLSTVRDGACLEFEGRLIWVDAPCSGLRMMWGALFLALSLAALARLEFWATLRAIVLGVFVVVLANILRTTALFFVETERVTATSDLHQGVGLLMYVLTALVLFLSIRPREESPCCVTASS